MHRRSILSLIASIALPAATPSHAAEGPRTLPGHTWMRRAGVKNGEPFEIAYPSPLYQIEIRRTFPFRSVLEYEYDKEGSNRLPNMIERDRIQSYENGIAEALLTKTLGVLVLSLASYGLAQIVSYVKDELSAGTLIPTFLPAEATGTPSGRPIVVTFNATRDQDWSYVAPLLASKIGPSRE